MVNFTFSIVNKSGEVETNESQNFKRYAALEGMDMTCLYQTFSVQGKSFKLIGFNARAPKLPIQGVCVDTGGSYKHPYRSFRLCETG